MSHLLINLDIKRLGQYIENIKYFGRLNDYGEVQRWAQKLSDYIDVRVTQTSFEKGNKNG